MNRTNIVRLLDEKGEKKTAKDYSEYYLQGWQYFLSSFDDHNAARNALSSAVEVLKRGVEIADSWSSKHG
jgi:hypothetical protein